jgi:hypothetical protein
LSTGSVDCSRSGIIAVAAIAANRRLPDGGAEIIPSGRPPTVCGVNRAGSPYFGVDVPGRVTGAVLNGEKKVTAIGQVNDDAPW